MSTSIEIYQGSDGAEVEVRMEGDTIWLTQRQMAELFGKDTDTIGLHLKHIYADEELDESSTTEEYSVVRIEGSRTVRRKIKHYNLDAIISVGYRVNSKQGTQFRIWATQRLRDYLVEGYALNQRRLAQTQQEVQVLRSGIQMLGRALAHPSQEEAFSWLDTFAKGLQLLDDYDHEALDHAGLTVQPATYPSRADYQALIDQMKSDFQSAVFGVEKDGGFDSAIHQIAQGVGEEDLYPSLEEKATMLLYLVIKNHAFADGNKRIAAACFLLFLQVNGLLITEAGQPLLSHEALASMTLLIASSQPAEKDTIKRLVISVLNRNQ